MMAMPERVPVQLWDGAASSVTHFSDVLPPGEISRLRGLIEQRALDDEGLQIYNNPATSNSGAALHSRFAGPDWTPSLLSRMDIAHTQMRFGGRFGRGGHFVFREPGAPRPAPAADAPPVQKKGGQFRATLAGYGGETDPGIVRLMNNAGFLAAARELVPGRALVDAESSGGACFCNIMVPGETQAPHHDVPAFRGVDRTNTPEWVCVCMHHSDLFDSWRKPIVTSITWLSDHTGGELCTYPDLSKPAVLWPTPANSAVLLEADGLMHGVDAVGGRGLAPPVVPNGCVLRAHGRTGRFGVQLPGGGSDETPVYVAGMEDLGWGDLRCSIQWKATAWRDEAERALAASGADDLDPGEAYELLLKTMALQKQAAGEPVPELAGAGEECRALCTHFMGQRVPAELRTPHTGAPTGAKL
jgi:hypothetical protein